jgi:hypothetical protein
MRLTPWDVLAKADTFAVVAERLTLARWKWHVLDALDGTMNIAGIAESEGIDVESLVLFAEDAIADGLVRVEVLTYAQFSGALTDVVDLPAAPVAFTPPAPEPADVWTRRLPPTPPPEAIVVPKIEPEPVPASAPEPIVEHTPEPVAVTPPEPIVEYTPEPIVEYAPEPVVAFEHEPEPEPVAVAEPVVAALPETVAAIEPEPVAEEPPEPVIVRAASVVTPLPAVPAPAAAPEPPKPAAPAAPAAAAAAAGSFADRVAALRAKALKMLEKPAPEAYASVASPPPVDAVEFSIGAEAKAPPPRSADEIEFTL